MQDVSYFRCLNPILFGMKKISKKYIRTKLVGAVDQAIEDLELSPASKKARKLVSKASKEISAQLKSDYKKLSKKADKIAKSLEKKEKRAKKRAEESDNRLEPALN